MGDTLRHISGDINNGISVFYLITCQCAYSLGYLPEAKSLPAGNLEIADELHRERILAAEWLIQDGEVIKNRIAPEIIRICGEFAGYMASLEGGKGITDKELIRSLNRLQQVVAMIDTENIHLTDWLKKISALHEEAMGKAQAACRTAIYSWQDAADKLDAVLQTGDKISVLWNSVLLLVGDAVKELEQAKRSGSDIVREMYCDAAVKQWEDAAELSKRLQNAIEYSR